VPYIIEIQVVIKDKQRKNPKIERPDRIKIRNCNETANWTCFTFKFKSVIVFFT